MTSVTYYARDRSLNRAPSDSLSVVKGTRLRYRTTTFERLLLMVTVTLMPLQDHIPAVAGLSTMYIVFAALAGYVLLNRLQALARTWLHPVFLAAYTLLITAFLVEFSHPFSNYFEIFRLGQMIAGGVFVASLCRDRQALRAGIYGYLLAGMWLSVLLFLSSYGTLHGVTATNFQEAGQIRNKTFAQNPLHADLNAMAFVAAQGTVVALALALTAGSSRRRNLLLGMVLFCLVATFLPFSRGGVVIVGVLCATVLLTYGISIRIVVMAVVLGAGVLMLVPNVVFSRLTFSIETHGGKMEGRARVYTSAVENLPEYWLTGVGAGNFYEQWGSSHGFGDRFHGDPSAVDGAHNCFFQVTIYWGLAGLLALIALIWQVYRHLPKQCGNDALALCLLGISVSLLMLLMVVHTFYAKEFSLGLGLLVGARCWIWPQGIVHSSWRERNRLHSTLHQTI